MKLDQVARWTEIVASLGVIVTLVLLVREVRDNTRAMERDALAARANTIFAPFLEESPIPAILTKVKTVDGGEALEQAYIERYGMTYEEAGIWSRYQGLQWSGLEADYTLLGDSPLMAQRIRLLLERFPDVQLWWELASPDLAGAEFREYVQGVLQGAG